MTDLFLGIIAAAVLIMAVIQVGAVVMAARAAQNVRRLTSQLEHEIRPVLAHLQAAAADAKRSTAVVAGQVERVDGLVTDLSARLEQTFATIQTAVTGASHMSGAWIAGLKAVVSAIRDIRDTPRRRQAPVEDDSGLFIG